jgi:hypothetical protein
VTFRRAHDEPLETSAPINIGDLAAVIDRGAAIAWGRIRGYASDGWIDLTLWTDHGVTDVAQLEKATGVKLARAEIAVVVRGDADGAHPTRRTCVACGRKPGRYRRLGCGFDVWIEPPPPGIAESEEHFVPQVGGRVSYVNRVRGSVGALVTARVLQVDSFNQRAQVAGLGHAVGDPWIAFSALTRAENAP